MNIGYTILGIIAAIALFVGASFVSTHNYGATMENTIIAANSDSQNTLSQYTLTISEMAQVPSMYRDDVKTVFTAAMGQRYGAEGSKAMFQMLKEQNPNLDPKMYTKIQEKMEAGRNEFKTSQTKLIDTKRAYKTSLDYFWTGFLLRSQGFPKIDLDKYKVIMSVDATETFATGVDKGLTLRK